MYRCRKLKTPKNPFENQIINQLLWPLVHRGSKLETKWSALVAHMTSRVQNAARELRNLESPTWIAQWLSEERSELSTNLREDEIKQKSLIRLPTQAKRWPLQIANSSNCQLLTKQASSANPLGHLSEETLWLIPRGQEWRWSKLSISERLESINRRILGELDL